MWGHAETSAHVRAVDDTLEGRDSPEQRLARACRLWLPGNWLSRLWRTLRFVTFSACRTTLGGQPRRDDIGSAVNRVATIVMPVAPLIDDQ
jgi:hypothetical protein